MNPVIRKLHEAQLRKDLPEFRAGDTVRVNVRLQEGEGEKVKERLQAFEGVVISKRAGRPVQPLRCAGSVLASASNAFSLCTLRQSVRLKSLARAKFAARGCITCAI